MDYKKFQKRKDKLVVAVQLNLKTNGIDYIKWGSTQHAKAGDWIIDNNGECYTVDSESFASTYEMVSPGMYYKTSAVWAVQAGCYGTIETKEGTSSFCPDDYIVYNDNQFNDGYCISRKKFESMYEEVLNGE